MAEFTAEEKRECAEREVRQRERVYPRLVEKGSMNPHFAERQIALMKAIAADYEALARGERLI